jgi:hypothetical protein
LILARTKSAAALAIVAGAVLGAGSIAHAQCSITKLQPADVATSDFFGGSMSMSTSPIGTMCAVGMPADDTNNGVNAGSVRFALFSSNTWFMTDLLTLAAADGAASNAFGAAVALEDPYIAVGATGVGANGAVYFYQRSGLSWNLESKVPAPVGVNSINGQFGRAIGLSQGYAIIGQPYASPHVQNAINSSAGLAYFFQRQANGQWTLQQTIKDADESNLEAGAHLGLAASMEGHVAVVGVPSGQAPDYVSGHHGAIHIYRRNAANAWVSETASVWGYADPGAVDGDLFGAAVSTDGNSIAIGAPNHTVTQAESGFNVAKGGAGVVYILTYSNAWGGWQPNGKIIAPDVADNANFGSSVSIAGNRVAIAAGGVGAHKAYVYRYVSPSNWVLDGVVTDPDGVGGFGSGLAFDGQTAIIGDMNDNQNGLADSGAIYVAGVPTGAGDSCQSPVAVTSYTMTGCTTYCTRDGWTSCGESANGDGPDSWLSWTAACTANVTVDTLGSGYDTILSVHSACPEVDGWFLDSHTIACNDDGGVGYGYASKVSFDAVAGTTYLFRVSGYNGAKGPFTLHIAPASVPSNDSCSTPQVVAASGDYAFKTCNASTDPNITAGGCGGMTKDVWFVFTPPVTGVLKADTCNSNFDTMLAVYGGGSCPGANTQPVACNDDSVIIPSCGVQSTFGSAVSVSILGGFPYLIRVGGFPYNNIYSGEGVLHVEFNSNCPADFNLSGTVTPQDIFDFLNAWFAGDARADFNHAGGISVQDIFDFLNAWFTGCP